ncbi:hypothetical protein NKI12_16395 [Mesorhizobium australicum]|uniref:Uncharacterized protein n=1 Tax=Mesorhizobium australicum TaxID=536018 RepID=A0ACC6SYH6_9HYPH
MNKYRAAFIPALLLVLALAPWPYAYYQLLRIVVTGWAAFLTWDRYQSAKTWTPWVIAFVALAVLFNPIAPIHLTRPIWSVLNVLGASVFAAFGIAGLRRKSEPTRPL